MSFVPPPPKRSTIPEALYAAERDKLRRVAKYQRWVLVALLISLVLIIALLGNGFQYYDMPLKVRYVIGGIRFIVCLFMTAMWFLVAKQLWHPAAAILGVVTLVVASIWLPIATIVVVLMINQRATRYLQRYGIAVGLLGADYKSI